MNKRLMFGNGMLCLIVFFICLHEMSAISQVDQERIKYGMEAAKSAAQAMKAVKFISWVSKVGSAAGAVLAVVSIVLDIVLSFLNIESPEMILMKAEFSKLNDRLDALSLQFQEVKRKIDWSSVQLKYAKHEMAIRTLSQDRKRIADAKTVAYRSEAIRMFKMRYEGGFDESANSLQDAMASSTILNNNIFEVSGRYTNQHPEETFHFMKGCTQLLIQGFALKATYIKLEYNSTLADQYFQSLVVSRMKPIEVKAKSVYYGMVNNWNNQMRLDVRRFALAQRSIRNSEFSNRFFDYISKKYIDRRWFVIVYNPIWTWENHGSSVCEGDHFFRLGGRNIVVSSFHSARYTGWSHAWANRVLSSFGLFRHDHDGAKALMNKVLSYSRTCAPVVAVAVVKTGSDTHCRASLNRVVHRVKSVRWCNTNLCWVKNNRNYDVYIFG